MTLRQSVTNELTSFTRLAGLTTAIFVLSLSPSVVTAGPDNDPVSEAGEQAKDADDEPETKESHEKKKAAAKPELPKRGIFELAITNRGKTQEIDNLRRGMLRLRGLTKSTLDTGVVEFLAVVTVNTTPFEFTSPQAALAACEDVLRVIQLGKSAKIQLGDLGAIEPGAGGTGAERGIELAGDAAASGAGLSPLNRQENINLLRAYLHTRLADRSGNSRQQEDAATESPSLHDEQLGTATLFSRSAYGFLKSTYSFEFATRNDKKHAGNDADLQYVDGILLAHINAGDGSRIIDLGERTWNQLRLADLPELPAQFNDPGCPAIVGHMYLVHTVDANSDLYTLCRVERQATDLCEITWKVISNDFGFEFAIRDEPRRVGNDWVIEFGGGEFIRGHVMGGKFRIATVGGDQARIVDLGDLRWYQLQLGALPKPLSRLQRGPVSGVTAIRNHIYLVHTVDRNPPLAALFRVEQQPKGHICDLTWKILRNQDALLLDENHLPKRLADGSGKWQNANAIQQQSNYYTGLQTATLYSESVFRSYIKATFSFEIGTRDNVSRVHNGWDLRYGWGNFYTVGNRQSRIVDLGQLEWLQVRLADLPRLPASAGTPRDRPPAVTGHMYLVHTMDRDSDCYALFRVERQAQGICDITWKAIKSQDQVVRSPPQNR